MNIIFAEDDGSYTGIGDRGREWRITRVITGWRLQLQDLGDTTPTNAGVYSSLQAAQDEAAR